MTGNSAEYNRQYWLTHGHQNTKNVRQHALITEAVERLEEWRQRALLAEAEEARLRAILEKLAPERLSLPQ